jgi:MFS family permease
MSVYLTGTFAGGALALILGGYLLEHWPSMCSSVPVDIACSFAGWKAALLIVGLPGLLLALLILTIREPPRKDARDAPATRFIIGEFATALPPFTLGSVYRAGGRPGLIGNLKLAGAIIASSGALIWITGDIAQWVAVAIGLYSITTWAQIQSLRDKPLFKLTFGDPTFLAGMGASALIACAGAAAGIWTIPYAMRNFAVTPSEIGLAIGLISVVGAIIGVLLGGWLADTWKKHDPRAPLWIMGISAIFNLPGIIILLSVTDLESFLVTRFVLSVVGSLWGGSTAAMIQDLVIPRMRGSAAACFSLVSIVVSSGLGPYWAGKISVLTGSLTTGMLSPLVLLPVALMLIWFASRRLPHETADARMARAVAAGEPESQEKQP